MHIQTLKTKQTKTFCFEVVHPHAATSVSRDSKVERGEGGNCDGTESFSRSVWEERLYSCKLILIP